MERRENSKHSSLKVAWRFLMMTIGSLLVAVGLEQFLIPNTVIDGGVVGVSIIVSHLTGLPLGLFISLLNLPFLMIGYKHIGKTFVLSTLFSVLLLSLFTTLLQPVGAVTSSHFLATVFGGVILGIGVGLIIRNGGSLDGTEIVAILLNRRLDFSVGEIVMFFNLFILGSAAFFFSPESAMYSLIAYFIAYKTIDIVMQGLDESKSVTIIAKDPGPLAEAIMARLGRGVTHVYGKGGYTGEEKEILYCVVNRLEVAKLKNIIEEFDPDAFVTIENVHDVMGGRFNKRSIH